MNVHCLSCVCVVYWIYIHIYCILRMCEQCVKPRFWIAEEEVQSIVCTVYNLSLFVYCVCVCVCVCVYLFCVCVGILDVHCVFVYIIVCVCNGERLSDLLFASRRKKE